MRDNKLHTPYGVKDYLPSILDLKKLVERRVESVFRSYHYLPAESPIFEHIEVFEGKGSVHPRQMYKFIDREGEILALRSDITPAIARIAATSYGEADLPLRIYYLGNAFRYNESYQGKMREFTQAGVEFIGINSVEADSEALAVAVCSLLAAGLTEFRVDIGQVKFLKGILEEGGFTQTEKKFIHDAILAKNYVAVEKMASERILPNGVQELLMNLPTYIGSLEVVEAVKKRTSNSVSLEALQNLEAIYEVLSDYGLEKYVRFDLSMSGHLDYYTGIIFNGYTKGVGFSILDGGRYDHLLAQFGADWPSVGFGIKINELLSALMNQKCMTQADSNVTLLGYAKEGRKEALLIGDELRRQGVTVENSLIEGFERNIQYAKNRKMNGVLFFEGAGVIRSHDVKADWTKKVTLEELKGER